MKINLKQHQKQRGLSLIEAALAIALMLFVITWMAIRSTAAVADQRAQGTTDSMREFTRHSTTYVARHRDDILHAVLTGEDPDRLCMINVDYESGNGTPAINTEKHLCFVDVSLMKHKRILPETYPETNSYHQKWVVIYRAVVDDYGAGPISQGDIEMLVLGVDNPTGRKSEKMSPDEAILAASLAGGNAGIVASRQIGPCKKNEACSTSGTWKLDVNEFIDDSLIEFAKE